MWYIRAMDSTLLNEEHLKTLALAVARNKVGPNDPIEEILAAQCTSPDEFTALLTDPLFKRYVREYVAELTEKGVSFVMKARILAEAGLPVMHHIVLDNDAPATSRVRAQELLTEWGQCVPKDAVNAAGPGFSITVNIPSLPSASIQVDAPARVAGPAAPVPQTIEALFAPVDGE